MDNDTRQLVEQWKRDNPIEYLREEIKGLKIAFESASTAEERQYINKQIADINKEIRELEHGLD
jgi:hypothetical protein